MFAQSVGDIAVGVVVGLVGLRAGRHIGTGFIQCTLFCYRRAQVLRLLRLLLLLLISSGRRSLSERVIGRQLSWKTLHSA